MVQLLAACSIIHGIRLWRRRSQREESKIKDAGPADHKTTREWDLGAGSQSGKFPTILLVLQGSTNNSLRYAWIDADLTDPGLLKKHSTFKSYTTSTATYPSIRTFYRLHSQADKLPSKPTPLPLLVFVHGLGGSLAQFNPLLTSLVNVGPCLGVDLPGCGRSAFSPTTWDAYTPKALAELLCVVIAQNCAQDKGQGVILIGHSAGCSYSTLVAQAQQRAEVLALVAICPQATPPSEKQIATFEKILRVPTPIFNLWRTWDRRGGPESASVARFVGKNADIEVKKLQERFNTQSRTAVWRRMAWGALPRRERSKEPEKGLPGLDVWASLKIPLFLVGGEGDGITKTDQITKIGRALGKVEVPTSSHSVADINEKSNGMNGKANRLSLDEKRQSTASHTELTVIGDNLQPPSGIATYSKRRRVLKTSILPAPASHALLYDPATYRTLAGLIQDFMSEHVDTRLSLGWQLQHLSTEGKWDVKNLAKWQAVRPVSEPIAGIFRAMKTLREIDDTHSPEIFVRNWKGRIKAVIDISHESPVYDPKGLERGGIEYHKFPTVSKIPPTPEEADDFIKLVDRLRAPASGGGEEGPLIAVHCHYGFNRTGFFICCYLIEKEGYGVQQAIDAFAAGRPKGINHEHFLDQLFVRYCVGLKRAPTM
ncbi:hypothetical protein OEA41_009571 [Lepraria neglecta]|uniref:Uncharacterized protein n=1 Tax=Lepraria neglecta TaxID=209136 RepID=A0AAE0DI54_9LECA|nr:hypothetical protein OEA41_009571 [Lepraria neglecta]